MKTLLIAGMLVVIACQPVHARKDSDAAEQAGKQPPANLSHDVEASSLIPKKTPQASNTTESPASQNARPTTVEPKALNPESGKQEVQGSAAEKNQPHRSAALINPEWWLVVAAFLTLVVIGWQAIETRRAVEASRASAEALVDIERAWILGTEIGKIPEFQPDPYKLEILWVKVTFKNFGRTPARVIRTHIKQEQIKSDETRSAEPKYESAGNCDFVLPPETAGADLSVGIPASDFTAIWRGEKILYLYGFIDYRDVGEANRQTRFCYRYHVPGGFNPMPMGFYADLAAPNSYTRCT